MARGRFRFRPVVGADAIGPDGPGDRVELSDASGDRLPIVADRRTKTFFQQATFNSIIGRLHPHALAMIPFQISGESDDAPPPSHRALARRKGGHIDCCGGVLAKHTS